MRDHTTPARLRGDYGKENLGAARYMLGNRGFGCRAVLTGPSVPDHRIERLWRDCRRSVILLYWRLFPHMEYSGMLDMNNQVHLFCLQYIFKARVNDALKHFVKAWNSHPFSGECNRSPNQLVVTGLLEKFHSWARNGSSRATICSWRGLWGRIRSWDQ